MVSSENAAITTGSVTAFAGTTEGLEQLRVLMDMGIESLTTAASKRSGPVPPGGPDATAAAVDELLRGKKLLTDEPSVDRLRQLFDLYATWATDLTHPSVASRMQCPPTAAGAAAEVVAAVLNQSLQSWESGPFAIELERRLLREMASWVGFGETASGTLTPGGSISNLVGLLLSRDHALRNAANCDASQTGLTGIQAVPRVLCSESTHFSITRAIGFLGLGRDAVISVPVDEAGRMIPQEARRVLDGLSPHELPVAVVATAGTTDHGAFDPLPELAEIAEEHRVWLHVDAAYGIGALFSPALTHLLQGVERADSVTFDMHKFGWTPASSSVLLVRDASTMQPLSQRSAYLNPADEEAAGLGGLLSSSMQTTRRSDALKIAACLLLTGREGLGAWVDSCHAQARHAAAKIMQMPHFDLSAEPQLSVVVFRCTPQKHSNIHDENAWHAAIRARLMTEGQALVARTRLRRADGEMQAHLRLVFLTRKPLPSRSTPFWTTSPLQLPTSTLDTPGTATG
ncbi:pyridoxal phosphate-dependent decarboxylase family protein [Streptomyces lavendofoliae]|uniref:pyridoxal phosphate-dependent decarboxylase family protein n=1 Tax=Streptomyces lavendofoliae TaxID=67314 RepID=UPI003D8A77AD